MSTQQDIYAAGSESRPPMLNKENYVSWSSRLLRYAKSRPNGKLIHNSIINGPYVRCMIPEPGDTNEEVLVNETFYIQTDDELTEKELKQIEADDQAIQTIFLGLPEDIYAAVDSCETAQEIWLRVQQMMKGSYIGIQEKKAKLFNEWERFTSNEEESIESYYHHFLKLINDLKRNKHFPEKIATDYTQLYDFLKYNQKEVDELKAERLAKTQDPLALMANSNNPYNFPAPHQDQPSFNQNYMQQPMLNLEDITDPTIAMNMALALMPKAFKLNYSTPTNNNQRISSNPRNRQIAQPGMNMGQDRQIQMVGGYGENQFRQYAGQNVGNLNGQIGVPGNANLNGNGNLGAARAERNAAGQNGNQIRCYNCRGVGHFARNCIVRPRRRDAAYLQTQLLIAQKEEAGIQLQAEEFDLMAAAADLDEIKEVNANCILIANLQQASTSGTQSNKAPVYDSDGSVEKMALGYQNPFYLKQAQKKQQSLYDGKVLLEKHDPPVVHDSEETMQLAQESREKIKQMDKEIKQANYTKINHLSVVFVSQTAKSREELYFSNDSKTANISKTISIPNEEFLDDTTPSVARKFLNEEAAKFVGDFKSLAKEADESLAKHKTLELEIERLLRAVVSQDIMFIVQKTFVIDTSNLQTELEQLEFQVLNYARENAHLKATYKNLFDSISVSHTQKKTIISSLQHELQNTIYENDKLRAQLFKKISVQKDNTCGTSKNTKFAKQTILGKPPMLDEIHALSKPVTSNSVPTPQESQVMKNDKDLKKENVLGTGSECGGLYMFDVDYEVFGYFVDFVNLISNQFLKRIKVIRSDNGTQFINNRMDVFLRNKGIVHQTSCTYTPQQNGIAERKHIHLLNVARSLLFQRGIPLCFWTDCVLTATYSINMLSSSVLAGPFDDAEDVILDHQSTDTTEEHPFNDDVYTASSMDDHPISEGNVPCVQNVPTYDSSNRTNDDNHVCVNTRRSSRVSKLPDKLNDFVLDNKVKYGLIRKAIRSKWVYKIKYKTDGKVERYKARVVAKGFGQKEGVDYEEIISPVVKMSTVRCFINMAIQKSCNIFQMDVNNAFLYGDLTEDVYMIHPLGFFDKNEKKVCKQKSKKQATLSRSSAEAEYRSMASAVCEIATNPVMHEKTKHFDIDVHLIREKVAPGLIKTVKVDSEKQIADILTKDDLFTAFAPQEISTYKYDPTVPVDKSIVHTLVKAIKDSQISLVIFSENYADSYLCLEELACIMKCKDERGLIVMPIFYHVDPIDEQKLTGKYGEALEKHELENKDKVESWKKALVDASSIAGWEVNHIANGNESRYIKEIVETILNRLNRL
nr:TMV resistance protein N-like [Tanacetum cinerariifolium]